MGGVRTNQRAYLFFSMLTSRQLRREDVEQPPGGKSCPASRDSTTPRRGNAGPRPALERSEAVEGLQRALLRLTAEQREVFVLKHVEGLSYDEIAGRLSTSVAALKMRMHRAYDRLRELLEAP